MSNNRMRRTFSILVVLLLLCGSLPIDLSPIGVVSADAYDYDVYMHPDDLAETFTATQIIPIQSGVVNTSVDNSFDYNGKYVFVVVDRITQPLQYVEVNGEILTPFYSDKIWDPDNTIYFYLVNYSSSWQVNISSGSYLGWWTGYVKRNFILQGQMNKLGTDGDVLYIFPFYPRYSEADFQQPINMRYPDVNILQSDYIGSNVAVNVSTRTIDDIGFHGSVYLMIYKNKTGAYPDVDGLNVKTDLWGPAKYIFSLNSIEAGEYYQVVLWRLGYIDSNPLSTSKDIEINITDSNPSVDEHLSIARYDPQLWNPDFYTYYRGYQSTTKTDYLINAYTTNDYYANLKVHVYDSDTGLAISDALVELDGEPTTWQSTDSLGDVLYDNIDYGVTRYVHVTRAGYPDYDGSIYLVAGYNTLNVPLGAVTVGPETTLYTDAYWYDRYDTVTFTYNIAGADWSTGEIYDIEIRKAYVVLGVALYYSSYDSITITQSQSSTATWTVTEQGVYKANLRRSGTAIVESNQFSVTETVVTPTGNLTLVDVNDVTIPKSSFNISETIVLNVTDMNMEGQVIIREKGFYPQVKSIYIPESGLYNTTMTYAGIFTAQLEVVHLGSLVVLDLEEFTVTEDKDFAYITIRNIGLELAKGETLYFWAYSPDSNADVSIYNPNDTIVMSKQSLALGDLVEFTYQIPANAIEGIYTIRMTNATTPYTEFTNATFRIVGDRYNWIQWDKDGYWLVGDSVITTFSYSNIYEGVKLGVYKMELASDGEWYISNYNSPLLELEYKSAKPSGREVIEIGVKGRYRVVMWEYQHLLGYWILMPEPLYSDMEVTVPEAGQIIDGVAYVPDEPITGEGLFALYPIFEPWEKIFGNTIGKGMFAIMVIVVMVLTMAMAEVAMSVIGLISIFMVLVFVWVGLLPLFIGILLVILGSIQIVKMYTGGR